MIWITERCPRRPTQHGDGLMFISELFTDSFVFSEQFKATEVGQELNDRVIGDFSNPENYERNLVRLLSTLRIKKPDSIGVYENFVPN